MDCKSKEIPPPGQPAGADNLTNQNVDHMKMKLALPTLMLCGTATAGVFTPLPLPTLTDDIRTWTDGSAYAPLYPSSSMTLAGVPFAFQEDAQHNTIFYGGNLASPSDATLTIPVNVFGVTAAYTLINSAYGAQNSLVGRVTFEGSGGLSYSVDLIEGVNVRDHYYGGYVNTTTDPSVTQAVFGNPAPGNAHYDMQTFLLPSAFQTATLQDILFTSLSVGTPNPNGKALIAGATVASAGGVPDGGSTIALLSFGFGLLAAGTRKLVRR
jgi:hypothetical protein